MSEPSPALDEGVEESETRDYSIYAWLLVAVVAVLVGFLATVPNTGPVPTVLKSKPVIPDAPRQKAPPPEPVWRSSDTYGLANSPLVKSKYGMSFPYRGAQARITVSCGSYGESATIKFTEAPNIVAAKQGLNGFSEFHAHVEWDGKSERTEFWQEWGSSTILFADDNAIAKLAGANTMLIKLRWYGQELAYFEFPLKGSSAAIKNMRSNCS